MLFFCRNFTEFQWICLFAYCDRNRIFLLNRNCFSMIFSKGNFTSTQEVQVDQTLPIGTVDG